MSMIDFFSPEDINKAMASVQANNSFQYKGFFQKVGLSSKSGDQVKKVFEILDRDENGFIEEDDLVDLLKNFRPNARRLTAAETADFMKAGDPDNKGKIGLGGFIAMVKSSKHQG